MIGLDVPISGHNFGAEIGAEFYVWLFAYFFEEIIDYYANTVSKVY